MKNIKYLFFLLCSYSSVIFTMELISCSKNSKELDTEVITNATHYYVNGKIDWLSKPGNPLIIEPNIEFNTSENTLKHNYDLDTQPWLTLEPELNKKIDPNIIVQKPVSAKINYHSTTHREISYFGRDNNLFFKPRYYYGTIDIKNKVNSSMLINPNYLLDDIKKVDEYSYVFSPKKFSYLKKTLTYNDDKTKTETITKTHRAIQGMQIGLGLGFTYIGYLAIKKLYS